MTVWVAKETRGRDLTKDGVDASVPAAPAGDREDAVSLG